jgi:hypothetical protein
LKQLTIGSAEADLLTTGAGFHTKSQKHWLFGDLGKHNFAAVLLVAPDGAEQNQNGGTQKNLQNNRPIHSGALRKAISS